MKNKKHITWFYEQLPQLVSAGIITSSIAGNLRRYFGEIPPDNKKKLTLIICAVLGGVFIGLGIILLLAHNWENFPRPLRATLSILLLLSAQLLSFWSIWRKRASDAFKESAATFLALMVGASIALIWQTYNIPEQNADFFLTWMLLILPLVYIMDTAIPAVIYLIGMTAWAENVRYYPLLPNLFWFFGALVIPYFIRITRRREYNIRAAILSLTIAVTVCIVTGFALGKIWPMQWIINYAYIFTALYLVGAQQRSGLTLPWLRPFQVIGMVGIIGLSYLLSERFLWNYFFYYYSYVQPTNMSIIFDQWITIFLLFLTILFSYFALKQKRWQDVSFGAMAPVATFAYLFAFNEPIVSMIIFNAYLLMVGMLQVIDGIRQGRLGRINFGLLMVALLIIIRFFDSDIGFVVKGLVFIILGVIFLLTNAVIIKRRGQNEK